MVLQKEKYKILPGPEAYLAPAAALMGVVSPNCGEGLVEGGIAPESEAIEVIARKLAEAKRPAVCVGPLLLWQWDESAGAKAAAVKELAEACGAKILVMPDYSAKRINPDAEISPNHPVATIRHNDTDVCVFAGVHSHFANVALRLIRGGTSCYTVALDDYTGSDEAMASLGGADAAKIRGIAEKVKALKGRR